MTALCLGATCKGAQLSTVLCSAVHALQTKWECLFAYTLTTPLNPPATCPSSILPVSPVIKDFCGQVGVNMKQAQGVVRLAKKNGEWLGFLA